MQYIDAINSEVFVADEDVPLFISDAYAPLRPLFASIFAFQPPRPLLKDYFRRVGL
jgi:hypothetical protein